MSIVSMLTEILSLRLSDGVTMGAEMDGSGNLYLSGSGAVSGDGKVGGGETSDEKQQCQITADGSSLLPENVTVKHTTAKTYERNHSDAKVLSVEISGVKNDRLPEKPGKPTEPQTPEEPEKPRYGSLKLTKVDQETGEVLSGAEFVITNEEGEILHLCLPGSEGACRIYP